MGNKLSTANTISPEPLENVLIDPNTVCFICLEGCRDTYETRCECRIYCHGDCAIAYGPYRRYNCPICRSDSRPLREIGCRRLMMYYIRNSCLVLTLMCLSIFVFCVLPLLLGILLGVILYNVNNSEESYGDYMHSNIYDLWILGLLLLLIIRGIISIIKCLCKIIKEIFNT